MIVLGQNSIAESHPVVVSPSASRCVFSKRPEPRSGFASVKKPYPMLFDQADETFCQGCDPTEFLEEIQGRPFDQENLCLRTDQGSDGLAELSFGSIVRTFLKTTSPAPKASAMRGMSLIPQTIIRSRATIMAWPSPDMLHAFEVTSIA